MDVPGTFARSIVSIQKKSTNVSPENRIKSVSDALSSNPRLIRRKNMTEQELLHEYTDHVLGIFCRESDEIEGESWDDEYGVQAAREALKHGFKTLGSFLSIHKLVGMRVNEPWVGRLRKVGVRVGDWIAPNPGQADRLMFQLVEDLPKLNSWEAYIRFEQIHPFQDMNGRVGRLLWLWKFNQETGRIPTSFLREFHYQTLKNVDL
jgi:fido (protein-threonine AMPylation protein)